MTPSSVSSFSAALLVALLLAGAGVVACDGAGGDAAQPTLMVPGDMRRTEAGPSAMESLFDAADDYTLVTTTGQMFDDAGPPLSVNVFDAQSGVMFPTTVTVVMVNDGGDAGTTAVCPTEAGTIPVDLDTDPHHCGKCSSDCDGGACVAGGCAPLPADVLVSGQYTPGGIAVDAMNVYWVNRLGPVPGSSNNFGGGLTSVPPPSGQVLKCAKTGCANRPTVLASGPWSGLSKVVVDANNVYWISSGAVYACAIDGCNGTATAVWQGDGTLFDVAVNSTGIFFSISMQLQVLGCGLGDCDGGPTLYWSPPASSSGPAPFALTVDNSSLIVGFGNGSMQACTLGSCNSTWHTVLQGQAIPSQMVLGGGVVYFFGGSNGASTMILKCDAKGCGNGPSVVATALSSPTGLAVDSTDVYFTDQGDSTGQGGIGRVAKCALSGCGESPSAIAGYVSSPQGIAVDDTNVYWTDFGNTQASLVSDDGRIMVRHK